MKDFFVKIAEQAALVLLILGAILAIFGISGDVKVSGVSWLSITTSGKIASFVIGVVFILLGTFLLLRDNVSPKREDVTKEKSSTRFLLPNEAFGPNPNMTQILSQASAIYILGYSFVGFLGTFNDSLAKAVSSGTCIKVMIIHPKKQAIKLIQTEVLKSKLKNGIITEEEAKTKTAQKLKKIFRSEEDIEGSLSYVKSIARRSKGGTGTIELRFIDWIPSCSMIFLNPEREDGKLILGIYTPYFHLATENRPHMVLTAQKDAHWYKSYLHQFNMLWKESDDTIDLLS